MTTTSWSAIPRSSSDAEFRTWGSAISAALAAAGLVQTADTGQINWSTVTAPAATSTYQGYEIWRMNDTQQATCPIYFKLEYGSSSGSAQTPSLRFTVGTSSNGSGTITGTTIKSATVISFNGNSGVLSLTGYACAVDGGFNLVWGLTQNSSTNYGFGFGFWRSASTSGVANANGGMWWRCDALGALAFTPTFYVRSGPIIRDNQGRPFFFPGAGSSGQVTSWSGGGNTYVFTPVTFNSIPEPMVGAVGVGKNDYAAGATVVATVMGSSHTYLMVASGSSSAAINGVDSSSSPHPTMAILYE